MFDDRSDAGKKLAVRLKKFSGKQTLVLGIPRGGVVTAYEIAKELNSPLDVIVPRKIGAPHDPEFAIGAVAPDGSIHLNDDAIKDLEIPEEYIKQAVEEELIETRRRMEVYRKNLKFPDVKGKIVIVVDDGIATGYTMFATIDFLRKLKPKKIVVAVPVSPPDTIEKLKESADDVICLETHEPFYAIGMYYKNFEQTTDEEVIEILKKAKKMWGRWDLNPR